mmetsp:Transcript_27064/g.76822  ORF Transcript_27064/g.76822 Transcript_27064/m.76822 type:complete len:626 (+) Transcript_27064:1-1878(+)
MFTLWIGWYGFNAGSTMRMNPASGAAAGVVAWNTTLAACSGGMGAYIYCYCVCKHLDTTIICNGILGGLVAITACCDVAADGDALIIGALSGVVVYPLCSSIIQALRLDDPVDAVAVHAACGFMGVVASAFCRPDCAALMLAGGGLSEQARFCQPGFSVGKQLVAQVWGLFTVFWWVTSISAVVWAFFAVSELIRSEEVRHLACVDELLCALTTPEPLTFECMAKWEQVVRRSPLAKRILRRHGWKHGGFDSEAPSDIWTLRVELQRARGEKAETGLELSQRNPIRILARLLAAVPPMRHLAKLRLRISPVSELSGLGAADMNGGSLAEIVRKLSDVQQEHNAAHSPLKHQVGELAKLVHSQGMLLSTLARGGRRRSRPGLPSSALPSVPEGESETTPSPTQSEALEQDGQAVAAGVAQIGPPTPMLASCGGSPTRYSSSDTSPGSRQSAPLISDLLLPPIPRSNTSTTFDTDRTASDAMNRMTPRSEVEDTPPPSVIGLRSNGAGGRRAPGGANEQEMQVQLVATQLLEMLQAQNGLLEMLTRGAAGPQLGAAAMGLGGLTDQQNEQVLGVALNRLLRQEEASSAGSISSGVSSRSVESSNASLSPRLAPSPPERTAAAHTLSM